MTREWGTPGHADVIDTDRPMSTVRRDHDRGDAQPRCQARHAAAGEMMMPPREGDGGPEP